MRPATRSPAMAPTSPAVSATTTTVRIQPAVLIAAPGAGTGRTPRAAVGLAQARRLTPAPRRPTGAPSSPHRTRRSARCGWCRAAAASWSRLPPLSQVLAHGLRRDTEHGRDLAVGVPSLGRPPHELAGTLASLQLGPACHRQLV